MIEQAKFTYSPLETALEKQKKQLEMKEENKEMLSLIKGKKNLFNW